MANYGNTVNDPSALVALGSPSLAAGDTIEFVRYGSQFTSADFSATDLLKITAGPGFSGSFKAENAGQLKLTANRTSTGAFWNLSTASRIDLLSTGSTGVIYKVHMAGSGQLWMSACKVAGGLFASSGLTYIAADVDLGLIDATGTAVVVQRKTSGAFVPTTVKVSGNATVRMETDYGTANVYGGVLEHNDVSITPTQMNLYSGVTRIIDSGTIGGMLLDGDAVLDFTQLKVAVTITGTTSVGPGCEIRYKRTGPTVTATFSATSTPYRIVYVD